MLLEETKDLPPALVQQLDRTVQVGITGLTAGDTRRLVKVRLIKLDALAAQARRRAQAAARRVWLSGRPGGRALLGAELSAEQAGTCWRALTERATTTFDPTDPRSLDQQQADLFTHLPKFAPTHLSAYGTLLSQQGETRVRDGLSDGSPATQAAQRARVQAVTLIPAKTTLDLSDNPASCWDTDQSAKPTPASCSPSRRSAKPASMPTPARSSPWNTPPPPPPSGGLSAHRTRRAAARHPRPAARSDPPTRR